LFASICWYSGPRNSSKWSSTWSAFCVMVAPFQNPVSVVTRRLSTICGEPAGTVYSAAINVALGTAFQGGTVFFQIGELIAMSMSRAKIAKPS